MNLDIPVCQGCCNYDCKVRMEGAKAVWTQGVQDSFMMRMQCLGDQARL